MTLETLVGFFVFAFGASIASFLNVVIWRVPRGESIVSPPSHCPKCGAPIAWHQNIPIVAWLALRGKCAQCRAPISPRYILIEILGGILFLLAYWRYPFPATALSALTLVVAWIWLSLMVVGSFVDCDLQLLPDFVTVGGMALGLLYHGACSVILFATCPEGCFIRLPDYPIVPSLAGLVFGFGLLWLIRFFGTKAFKREAMGLGDVFLMGAVGALFGPVAVLFTLIVSSVFGAAVGLLLVALQRARLGGFTPIPFGPYLCLGCLVWMLRGPELVTAYLHLLRF